MKLDGKFWTAQIVFQIIFAVAIFGITRAIYVKDLGSTATASAPVQPRPAPRMPAPVPSLSEEDPVRLAELADEWFNVGDFARAAEAYRKLIDLAPENPEHYNNLGITLHYLGRADEALQVLDQGSDRADGYPRLWLTLGFVRARQGLYDDARNAFQTAMAIAPESEVAAEAQRMLQQLP